MIDPIVIIFESPHCKTESSGGLLSWFGLPWLGDAAKKEEEEKEARRRKELHEKELFELQALKEQEEKHHHKLSLNQAS